ncbi:hypothetical protein [Streptomyces sp. NPDC056192]|uniref:hypothetical protein n=1 Tax=Streptomyces sp. NPDC056192 TaxID=3345743 RepID=UPI0035E1EDEA
MSFTNPPPPPSYPPSPPPPPEPPQGPGIRKLVIAAIVVAVLAAGGVGLAMTHQSDGGNDSSEDNASTSGVPADQPQPELACIASWNKYNEEKASVGLMETSGMTSPKPSAYVNASYSATFPDLCMITVANPANMIAQQYVEDSKNTWGFAPAWTGAAGQLDQDLAEWNAKMAPDGTITVIID